MRRQNGIEIFRCVWGTACLYRQVKEFFAVKMETTHFPETSVNPIRSLWYKIPEYGILLESQTCEPESRILTLGFESSFAELRKPPVSFMSVGPSSTWNNSDSTGRNLINFDIEGFFQICRESCCFFLNLSRITGTLHQYIYTFINVVELCLEWGMVQKSRKKIKTNFVIKKLKKNHSVYYIMRKHTVEADRP